MRKMAVSNKMEKPKKHLVKELNDHLTCTLCGGYLIDATTLIECLHVFCRGCIFRHLESNKTGCPSCIHTVYKKKQTLLKSDPQLQAIVYKLVPGLYSREMQRREDFYRSTGMRASSSCSDDSVLERERDIMDEEVSQHIEYKNQFFGPDDSISLSLEYYQIELDETPINGERKKNDNKKTNGSNGKDKTSAVNNEKYTTLEKRYLQCPAAVSMKHLQKFIRMKYALTSNHRVDIIYQGEVLPMDFSLMDVAYTFKWKKVKPMRFFYRIFTPLKIQPIKIINKPLASGEKQLQIVPVKAAPETTKLPTPKVEEVRRNEEEKERLLANLQLQSKNKVQSPVPEKDKSSDKSIKAQQPDCVFEYEEPDKEEIKRFAESRDREWAMQKRLDESRNDEYHHFSKKRKKNKHSKEVFKKRKIHAEITKEEELKLKVKLTHNNGHKHKHHKVSDKSEKCDRSDKDKSEKEKSDKAKSDQNYQDLSAKEKLLQMRQVRHKVTSEDKNVQTVSSNSRDEEVNKETDDKNEKKVTIKEWANRVPTVQIERNEQTEEQAKKTFLKTFPTYAEKYKNLDKRSNSVLERKIANLSQRCTIEKKATPTPQQSTPKTENHKPENKKPQYPQGFTVSKIEQGIKRKSNDEDATTNKRPSLEITLINPPSAQINNNTNKKILPPTTPNPKPLPSINNKRITPPVHSPPITKKFPPASVSQAITTTINNNESKPPVKRPPPATIPLDRIKKSISLKSGISIIPKLPEKCDNVGALDLSSKSNKSEGESTKINGYPSPSETPNNKLQLSNLQMLSKVATEVNKMAPKPRPQLPQLQTLKIPSLNPVNSKIPNLAKLPKLNEINKTQFRLMNPQIRNLRPNQNQNIRNIPNPSLLVRQQNQRINSINSVVNNAETSTKDLKPNKTTDEIKPKELVLEGKAQ